MTPGLSKDIWCHVWPYFFLNLQIARSDIRPHMKWVVSLVFAYGHFQFSSGVWEGTYGLTYSLMTPEGINPPKYTHWAQQQSSNKQTSMGIFIYLYFLQADLSAE